MANAATIYNLAHIQLAVIETTPTWIDLPYSQTLDPTIDQNDEDLLADSANVVSAYGAPVGSGSLQWARIETVSLSLLAGLTATSSGTTPNTIDRLVYLGDTIPPGIHISAWAKNVDANVTGAGLRLTMPNARAKVPSMPLAQETFSELSADLKFNADENNAMLILEFLETAPVFTGGVMPVNLTPPA